MYIVVLWIREILFQNDIIKRKSFNFAWKRLYLRDGFLFFNFLEYLENLVTMRHQGGILRYDPGDCFFCGFWEAEDVVVWMLLPFLTLYIIYGNLKSLNHLHNWCEVFFIILTGLCNCPSYFFLALIQRLEYVGIWIFAKYLLFYIISHSLHHIFQGSHWVRLWILCRHLCRRRDFVGWCQILSAMHCF